MGGTPATPNPAGEAYVSLTRPPATSIIVHDVPAPTELYVTDDSFIRVNATNVGFGGSIFITTRLVKSSDGQLTTGVHQLDLNSTPGQGTLDIKLQEGFLLSATVTASAPNLFRGNLFVALTVMRGSGTDVKNERIILADYMASNQGAGFPGGHITQSTEGRGALFHSVTAAAAAEVNITVPNFTRWEVNAIRLTLVTSAAAPVRTPQLRLTTTAGDFLRIPIVGTIAPSTTTQLVYLPGGPQPVSNNTVILMPLPEPCTLKAGDAIITVTTNLDAGDTYATSVHGEQWVLA